MAIPINELARRLCLAEHPLYASMDTGQSHEIPCDRHRYMAVQYYALVTPDGAAALKALIEAAKVH